MTRQTAIKVYEGVGGFNVYVPYGKAIELRENLISHPGLTTKPAIERTALEDLAIKFTSKADRYEKAESILPKHRRRMVPDETKM